MHARATSSSLGNMEGVMIQHAALPAGCDLGVCSQCDIFKEMMDKQAGL